MSFQVAPYPPFSWSFSRARLYEECPRRYFLRTFGGHNGWMADADPETRFLYAHRFLTTCEMVLGTAVHECARRCIEAVRDHRDFPPLDSLRQSVRSRLNNACRCTDREAFFHAPRQQMLIDLYYGRGLTPEYIARIRSRMECCLENLVSCPLWAELAECAEDEILLVDTLSTVEIDGATVYLTPDLLFHPHGRQWILVDWKTGGSGDASLQLTTYALWLEKGLGIDCPPEGIEGRVYRLDMAEQVALALEPTDLELAERLATESIRELRALLADPATGAPKPIEAFPRTENRTRCARCPYLDVCANEMGISCP